MKIIYDMLQDPINDVKKLPLSQLGRNIYRVHHSMDLKKYKNSHTIPHWSTFARRKRSCPLTATQNLTKQLLSSSFATVDRENTSVAINLVIQIMNFTRNPNKFLELKDIAVNTHKLIRVYVRSALVLLNTSMHQMLITDIQRQ